jgi:glutathione S-transferase
VRLYGCPGTRSLRVAWTLEEIGVDYEYRPIDLLEGEGRAPAFLAVNPAGKVPALIDGEQVFTESAAICLWLAARFPQAGLAPAPGTAEHGQFLRWVSFVVCELEQPLWTVSKHKFVLPQERRVPAIIDSARWEYGIAAELLAEGLEDRDFLAGERFTVADVLATHTLLWGRKAAPAVAPRGLDDYLQRMTARPAYARAREREAGAAA